MFKPLTNTIQGVFDFTLPMLIISIVVLVSLRLTYLIKTKEKIVLYKELLMLSFAIYIICLFQVVTFEDDTSWASNNFIPFKEILRYNITSRLFMKNVIGNMIMFLPYGFFISYYLEIDKVKLTMILTLIASISIETVQMCIGRVFDVDDILLNLVGGLIGYTGYLLTRFLKEKFPNLFSKEYILNIASICVLIGIFIILI